MSYEEYTLQELTDSTCKRCRDANAMFMGWPRAYEEREARIIVAGNSDPETNNL